MNCFFGDTKPIFIDDDLLEKTVKGKIPELPKEDAERVVQRTQFHEILKLHIEYKKILRIDLLWKFPSLTRLDLNNNLIEKIGGLDRLVNLTWLNLSYNVIETIEGLECLRKLEVLNLSNNKISVIENMDALENLTHFLLANNLLGQLNNVLYLRKFKKLFTLNLAGNPASKEDDYKLLITIYLPNLTNLDYMFLEETVKKEAATKYHYVLEEMRREELQAQQDAEAKQSQEAELKLHKDAFVEFLNGSYLFKSMFKDDPEAETLRCVPGVDELLRTFEHQMVELCVQLFETGLAEHKQRETEVNSFISGQTQAMTYCQQRASQILADFEEQQGERILELQQLSDPDLKKAKIGHCNDEISQLKGNLTALEFELVNHMDGIITKLDSSISDMLGNFTEAARGIFAQCRDLEDDYYKAVQQVAAATLEQAAKDSLEEDVPDDVKMLFTDKDAVEAALATGHDNHLLKINDRETELVTRVSAWKVILIKEIQDKELKWNRIRISDIHRYGDYLKEQLKDALVKKR